MKKIKTASFKKLARESRFSVTLSLKVNDFMLEEYTNEDYIDVLVEGIFESGVAHEWEQPGLEPNYQIDRIIWQKENGDKIDITNDIMEYSGLSDKLVDLLALEGAGEISEYPGDEW